VSFFLPLPRGRKRGGSEIMKGLLMAFFAIYGQVRTGFIARVTFRTGFLCFFSCADQIFIPCRHSFGTPSRKEGISFLFYDLFWTSMCFFLYSDLMKQPLDTCSLVVCILVYDAIRGYPFEEILVRRLYQTNLHSL